MTDVAKLAEQAHAAMDYGGDYMPNNITQSNGYAAVDALKDLVEEQAAEIAENSIALMNMTGRAIAAEVRVEEQAAELRGNRAVINALRAENERAEAERSLLVRWELAKTRDERDALREALRQAGDALHDAAWIMEGAQTEPPLPPPVTLVLPQTKRVEALVRAALAAGGSDDDRGALIE